MTVTRGSTNRNDRGSSVQRRSLKAWMLAEFGDGITAPCAFCGVELDAQTLTKDRHPKPGRKGGKYVKGNVRPACLSCNASEGSRQAAIERAVGRKRTAARNARRRELYALAHAQRPAKTTGGSSDTD